jgi:hypothetical protein
MAAYGYFYHVTDNPNWAFSVRLSPRITNRCDQDEPPVPRICVCPTVAGCFMAACYTEGYRRVYRTRKKVHAVEPYRVYDSKVTGELWLLEPTDFVLIHDFTEDDIERFPRSFSHCKTDRGMINSQIAAKKRLIQHFTNIGHELPRAQWI